jgi:hypothetical protein
VQSVSFNTGSLPFPKPLSQQESPMFNPPLI